MYDFNPQDLPRDTAFTDSLIDAINELFPGPIPRNGVTFAKSGNGGRGNWRAKWRGEVAYFPPTKSGKAAANRWRWEREQAAAIDAKLREMQEAV